jgi:hypothetical protein
VTKIGTENCLSISVFGTNGAWSREVGWVSQCYGSREQAPIAAFSTQVTGDANIMSFLLPQSGAFKQNFTVREVEAINGSGFEISHESGIDVVMIATSQKGEVETERLASNFAWTWARFLNREESKPTNLILVDGTVLKLEGREILKSRATISYLVAQQVGEDFSVETDGTVLNLRLPISDLEAVFPHIGRERL